METSVSNGICRCCASEGTFKDLKSIYHWMGDEEIYADMLQECFDITLSASESGDDGGICEVCITQLRNAANFKKQVQHTEEQFRLQLEGKPFKSGIIKIEPSREDDDDDNRLEADNISSDYSDADFEVPIKTETFEESKPKKRAVATRASTARAKKVKTDEGESSTKRPPRGTNIIKTQEPTTSRAEMLVSNKLDMFSLLKDIDKNEINVMHILVNSNANPIRRKDSSGYHCGFCTKWYPEPSRLKKHFLEEHTYEERTKAKRTFLPPFKLDITDLKCSLCDKYVDKLTEFVDHLITEHGKYLHKDTKHLVLPFKFDSKVLRCAICSTEHMSFKILQEHMNTHYRNHICKVCGSGYVIERLLQNHMKRHETGNHKCDQCTKTFSSEQKKREHLRRTHLGFGKRNKCGLCDEKFIDYWRKVDHMVKEHGASYAVIKCKACDKTFNKKRALTMHTKKDHLFERNHQCPQCEKSFFSKYAMHKHMTKHTGVKEFQCDVCLKYYGRKTTLREHMRIHEDDRRFSCTHCGQAFVQKCSWKGHMRSKHGELV